METTSSFGQMSDTNFNDTYLYIGSREPSDMNAAAALLQDGSTHPSHIIGNIALFYTQDNQQSTTGQMRAQSTLPYQPAQSNTIQNRPTSDDFMRDTFYTEMVFGSQNPQTRPGLAYSP